MHSNLVNFCCGSDIIILLVILMHKADGLERNLKTCMESTDLESLERICKFQNTVNCYESLLDSYEEC